MFAEFVKKKNAQIRRAARFEQQGSQEMAFLALWSVLEFGLKRHFGVDDARPLPHMGKIREEFSGDHILLEVLEPQNKWRKRRNKIAHDADEFGREATYAEYKSNVLDAIDELHVSLATFHSK
jgi:hypothetical protein